MVTVGDRLAMFHCRTFHRYFQTYLHHHHREDSFGSDHQNDVSQPVLSTFHLHSFFRDATFAFGIVLPRPIYYFRYQLY